MLKYYRIKDLFSVIERRYYLQRQIVTLREKEFILINGPDNTCHQITLEVIYPGEQPRVEISDDMIIAIATFHPEGQAYLLGLKLTAKLLAITLRDASKGIPFIPSAGIDFSLEEPYTFVTA